MLPSQLFKAVNAEQKVLNEEHNTNIEKDFVVNNWSFFAESKGAVKSALFQHPNTGTELLQTLGLQNVTIHKVKKDVLVKSVLKMENSEIFNKFLEEVKIFRELTVFFVVEKKALVMSNNQILKVPGKFIHKLESNGTLPDIYWQWAEDLAGKVRFY